MWTPCLCVTPCLCDTLFMRPCLDLTPCFMLTPCFLVLVSGMRLGWTSSLLSIQTAGFSPERSSVPGLNNQRREFQQYP